MKKQDWIEVLNTLGEKSTFDYIVDWVSIISPFLLLLSIYVGYKAAKASMNSVKLNKEIYESQEQERRLSFQPIFEIDLIAVRGDWMKFSLVNKNEKAVSIRHYGTEVEKEKILKETKNDFKLVFSVKEPFERKDYFKLWIYYTTLDHRDYQAKFIIRMIDGELIMEDPEITQR